MSRKELEALSREELIRRAEQAGVGRPRAMTVAELIDELVLSEQRGERGESSGGARSRGWFGRARDLLTSVIDRGLTDQPGPRSSRSKVAAPPPLPTVTLAEIYAAQGHLERAISTLDEVLRGADAPAAAAELRKLYVERQERTRPKSNAPTAAGTTELHGQGLHGQALHGQDVRAGAGVMVGDAVEFGAQPSEPNPSKSGHADAGDGSEYGVAALSLESVPPPPPAAATPLTVFEVDEVVAVAVDAVTLYLYWEVRPRTLARARAERADGSLVVRVLVATDGGAPLEQRDLHADALFGEMFVRGLPAGAEVRVSVGYRSQDHYEPFAIGMSLTTPRSSARQSQPATRRRFSDLRAEVAPEEFAALPAAPAGRSAGGSNDSTPGRDAARFPSAVWVDPQTTVVAEFETAEGGVGESVRSARVERRGGSSELFRREAVWSRSSVSSRAFALQA